MLTDRFARVSLAHLPTPLEPAPALRAALGGPPLWIKRDDCTGLATGGNKTRKLEFLMADAVNAGADCVLTAGGVQSNHARQTAAAAAKLGLGCEIILDETLPSADPDYRNNGNVLIDRLCGAQVRRVPRGTDLEAALTERAKALMKAGGRPYVIPVGGSNALGALGYVDCATELVRQSRETGEAPGLVVHASGSAGTQAGLVAGFHAAGADVPVLGICVSRSAPEQAQKVHRLAQQTLDLLGITAPIAKDRIQTNSDYVGDGYGIATEAMIKAVELTARTEGLLLDPVYSGKAMAGLIDLIRKQKLPTTGNVVFLHTGGAAGLFAYRSTFGAGGGPQP